MNIPFENVQVVSVHVLVLTFSLLERYCIQRANYELQCPKVRLVSYKQETLRKKSPNTGKCWKIQIRKNTACGHFSRNATYQIFERSIFVRTHVTVCGQRYGCNGCNCTGINDCPLKRKYFKPGIVYEATITNYKDDVEKINYGFCETAFKKIHTKSFNHEKNRNQAYFSNDISTRKKVKKTENISCCLR